MTNNGEPVFNFLLHVVVYVVGGGIVLYALGACVWIATKVSPSLGSFFRNGRQITRSGGRNPRAAAAWALIGVAVFLLMKAFASR